MARFNQITSNIFQVGGGSFSAPEDAAVYLIVMNERAAVVDAGCGDATGKILENISACGIDHSQIDWLLLTHCHFDHTGGAAEFREQTGCRIAAHDLDAAYLEAGDNQVTAAAWYGANLKAFPVDHKFFGTSGSIELGQCRVEAIHMPGHSPGSVVYVTETGGQKAVFAQDVHGPLDASLLSDRSAYQKSLKALLALEADILCEGHFGVYKGRDEIDRFVNAYLD